MVTKQIARKIQLTAEIENAAKELSILPDLSTLKTAAASKANSVKKLVEKLTKSPGKKPDRENREIKELKKVASDAKELADNEEARRHAVESRLAALENEFSELEIQVSREGLLVLQEQVEALERDIENAQEVLLAEEEKRDLLQLNKAQGRLTDLVAKKEDLLADEAIGKEIDKKELDGIEKQIAEADKDRDGLVDSNVTIFHTIEGLNKKISVMETTLEKAKVFHREAFGAFIQQEQEKIGIEYAELADKLGAAYLKIYAMDGILKDIGLSGTATAGRKNVSIPALGLSTCNKQGRGWSTPQLFSFNPAPSGNQIELTKKAREKAICELSQQGILVPVKM